MYKIFNTKFLKTAFLYLILCLLICFAFGKHSSINEMMSFYLLETIENYMGYIVLISRLILMFGIVLILYQDFTDLYGPRYIFINIRKISNKKYYVHILIKEVIYLIILSAINLLSQYISSGLYDEINLYLFASNFLNYMMFTFILFLLVIVIGTFFSQQYIYYFLLVITLIYMILFSNQQFLSILSYLNFNQSWLIIQIMIAFFLTYKVYKYQQTWR